MHPQYSLMSASNTKLTAPIKSVAKNTCSTIWPPLRCANELERCHHLIAPIKDSSSSRILRDPGTRLRLARATLVALLALWAANRTSDNMGAAQVVEPSPVQIQPRARPVSRSSCSDLDDFSRFNSIQGADHDFARYHLAGFSLALSPSSTPSFHLSVSLSSQQTTSGGPLIEWPSSLDFHAMRMRVEEAEKVLQPYGSNGRRLR